MQPSSRSSGSLHTPTDPLFFRYIHLPGTWTPGGHPRAFQAGDEPSSRFQTPRISNPGTGIPATGVSTPSMENDRRVAYVRDAPSKEPVNHMHTSIEIRIHLPLQCRIIVHGRGLLESRGVSSTRNRLPAESPRCKGLYRTGRCWKDDTARNGEPDEGNPTPGEWV